MATNDNTAATAKKAAQRSATSLDIAKSDETFDLAKDLAKFIKDNRLSTQVQGKEFVNVEGWQYAGSRLGIVPIVEHVINLSNEQELKYQAKVTLFDLRHQTTVGAGFAVCSNKESGKKFYQEFAIASMAQTRAIGKAYRNILAWIIRAAGYEPTPAEEMEYAGNVPTVAPAVVAEPVPVMHASRPSDPLAASQPPVNYATASQKEEIIRHLNHPLITRQEKTKMLLNINRLDEERAGQAIVKLMRAIEDREGTTAVAEHPNDGGMNEALLQDAQAAETQPAGNAPAGAPQAATPAGLPFADPAASTGSDQSSAPDKYAEAVADFGKAVAPDYSSPQVAGYAAKFDACTSTMAVNELWRKLTGGQQKELRAVKDAALARIKITIDEAAALAKSRPRQQPPVGLRDTGKDISLIAEFLEQPVAFPDAVFQPATQEQKDAITKLLDHPAITRREKTKLLLNLYKMDTERARQALAKLRTGIAEREGTDPLENARASVKAFVLRNAKKLSEKQVAELTSLATSPEVTAEFMLDAVHLAQEALIDDEVYGTDEELAALDGPDIAEPHGDLDNETASLAA
jgi:hypothetical protein